MTARRADRRWVGLLSDHQGATALEFAVVFPVFILFIFGMIAAYSLISCRRAMDYGIEKALRYAAVHGGAGSTPVSNAYALAASTVWPSVGTSSSVVVSPSTYSFGQSVRVTATYNWFAPAGLTGRYSTTLFSAITLTAAGEMRVVN